MNGKFGQTYTYCRATCKMRVKGSRTWLREDHERKAKGYKNKEKTDMTGYAGNRSREGITKQMNASAALENGATIIVDTERKRCVTE